MPGFPKILFPIDFSEPCTLTAGYVAGVAQKFNSHVTLLHAFDVYDPFGYGATSATVSYAVEVPGLWAQRETSMEMFGRDVFRDLPVERVIQDGGAGETIARYAREHGINLIIMPTHGYGGFRRLLLGSVTAKVLHLARCPVLTTSHSETMSKRCAECISHMVCGVDLGPDSGHLIRTAHELAQSYHASLRLVHAVSPDGMGSEGVLEEAPFQRFLVETATDKLAAMQRSLQLQLETCIRRGHVADVIREAVVEDKAGLAIIGRGHANKLLGTLRTNLPAIVRESPCPVLSF
jgi:nucleotide-binding universal stress UspA family protein